MLAFTVVIIPQTQNSSFDHRTVFNNVTWTKVNSTNLIFVSPSAEYSIWASDFERWNILEKHKLQTSKDFISLSLNNITYRFYEQKLELSIKYQHTSTRTETLCVPRVWSGFRTLNSCYRWYLRWSNNCRR